MAQLKRYKAKKDFKLDCGHQVKAGNEFVVTKTFTCELHAATMPYKAKQLERQGEGKEGTRDGQDQTQTESQSESS